MRATKRLRSIIDLIDFGDKVVADIGADHGYLSKILIEEKRASKIIATDISKPSLQKTANLAQKYNISDKILTKHGDGLIPIQDENVDLVVIAGMGGYEIIKILECSEKKYGKYIFQPVQNVMELREYLLNNKYFIIKDFVTEDKNKFYHTIEVEPSNKRQKLKFKQKEFGLTNFDLLSADFIKYLKAQLEKCENILSKTKSRKDIKKRKKAILKILREFNRR